MSQPKIYCIGLNKTGTTSLHQAFGILGLKSMHDSYKAGALIEAAIQGNLKLMHYMEDYDAFSDYPFFRYYKELDLEYPGSKFILNTRDSEDWVGSRVRHDLDWSSKNPDKPRRVNDKQKLLSFKESVEGDIRKYFQNRPSDFLVFDISVGDSWDKLCGFLNTAIPSTPFPYENRH